MSQTQLAARLGRSRSTVARWELGEMEPAYDAVVQAVAACGLSATLQLAPADASYLGDVGDQLRLDSLDRLRRLQGASRIDVVEHLAATGLDVVIIGDTAAALQGWPLTLPIDGSVEVCPAPQASRDALALTGVELCEHPPGTWGYRDLRRHRELVDVPGGGVAVASPLDLLRIEQARDRPLHVAALEAVLEHRRRWPGGPRSAREYTADEARAAVEAWLARH